MPNASKKRAVARRVPDTETHLLAIAISEARGCFLTRVYREGIQDLARKYGVTIKGGSK